MWKHLLLPRQFNLPIIPRSFNRCAPFRNIVVRAYSTGSEGHYKNSIPKKYPQSSSLWTVPNFLTMTRISTAPFIGHFILSQNLTPAFCLFTYSCITDFLDGYLARKYKAKSIVGTILDPMADKILVIITVFSLSFPPGPQLIPLPIAGLILGRDVLLGVSALFYRYSTMKHAYNRVTWNSYLDIFKYPSAEVKPTVISKWNTFLQMIYLGWGLLLMMLNSQDEDGTSEKTHNWPWVHEGFTYFGYLVGVTTLWSGCSYIFSKNAVKYLRKTK
ncbi:cardiolipin synthase Ecym_8067 [Eremothecium cymbalariae DBVPG|uniref:CDP-diacylglycerol--glycerol-3-phosphate 3-phosphatidyltransferase n=1 Tax=Eremothecium cymbalariae (strain CBS 270.75 / DBVPG 7215 / KCTC 17166 / NRRL Y-17582) TaxID=931890 RepID=G8JWY9_ERECY|nr:Hypothetical protein Ecym_8067 [Eremothecium cymbalariae DBVPG\